MSGSSGTTTLKSNLVPDSDNTRTIGSSAFRVGSVDSVAYYVHAAASDAQASTLLGSAQLMFGAGGASAQDVRLYRYAANVFSIDNNAGGVGALALGGANAAQSGLIRVVSNATAVAARNGANNADIALLGTDNINNSWVGSLSSANFQIKNGSTVVAQFGQAATDYVALGATPATAGVIRFPNNQTFAVAFRNAANNANVSGMWLDSANELIFGDSTQVSNNIFQTNSGSGMYWQIGGTNTASLSSTTFNLTTVSSILWATGITSPTIQQAGNGPLNATAQSITITPQAANASGNSAPGSLIVNLGAPAGSGSHGFLTVSDSGTNLVYIGSVAASTGYIWLGSAAPTSSNYVLASPSGSSTYLQNPSGQALILLTGSTAQMAASVGGQSGLNAFNWMSTSQSLAAGGTITLASSVYNSPHIKFTGSLPGNVIVVFPATDGAFWDLDFSAVTFNAHTITLQANSVNWSTTFAASGFAHITYTASAAKLVGNTMAA